MSTRILRAFIALLSLCVATSVRSQTTLAGNLVVQFSTTYQSDLTVPQVTADQNNYAPTGFSTAASLLVSTDASRTISGLAGGTAGKQISFVNSGLFPIILPNESPYSLAANRFTLGSDVTVPGGGGLILKYDGAALRWRAVGAPSNGTGSAVWGFITGSILTQTDLQAALNTKVNSSALAPVALSGVYADLTGKPTLGTASAQNIAYFATSAQGAKADTAVQPGLLATVATSGLYSDLTGNPTLGTAAALNVGTGSGTVAAGDDSRITGAAQKSSNLSDLTDKTAARTNLLLGSVATQSSNAVSFTGGTLNGVTVTGLPTPSASTDAVTKAYADGLSSGITPRLSTVVASTANLTLSGEQTIDGVLTSSSRILVKNQTTTSQNGIYVTASGSWSRATDSDTAGELLFGYYYFVANGTTQAATSWFISTAPTVLGTDPVLFSQFAASQAYAAGSGLTLTGLSFSVNTTQNISRLSNLATNGFVKTGSSNGTTSVDTTTYQTLSSNLTSVAGLSYVSPSFVKMTGANTFALDTSVYLTGNQSITVSGDATGGGTTSIPLTITKLNGVSLAGLGTGILKNTTGTGAPSVAVAGDFPTLNQNTSGNAATATALASAQNINGAPFDGTSPITVAAAAGTLTGTTLAANVVGSSLTGAAGGAFGTAAFTASTAYDAAGAASAAQSASQPLSSALTTYSGIPPSSNVQTLLGSADYAAFRLSLGITDVQVYTTTGTATWTKPANAKYIKIWVIGGGGGGGSGRKGAAGTNRAGGTGGGGAAYQVFEGPASIFGPTETVTVGAGGAGAPSQTGNSASGTSGTNGGDSSFGSWILSHGANAGSGGTTSTTSGGSGFLGFYSGGNGAGNSVTATANSASSISFYAASGGGGGGGISSADVQFGGGAGGRIWNAITFDGSGIAGGAGGSAGTNNGLPGTTISLYAAYGGSGGGGGGGSTSGNGGAGGNGAKYGAGGGGGGASTNSIGDSGPGGNAADGIVIVVANL